MKLTYTTRPLRTKPSPCPEKSRDEPELYPPPWMKTITGSGFDSRARPVGAYTFTVRQSSAAVSIIDGERFSRFAGICGAIAPKSVATRIPDHGTTDAGAANRNTPIGAAAYGMPRQPSIAPSWTPRTEAAGHANLELVARPAQYRHGRTLLTRSSQHGCARHSRESYRASPRSVTLDA